jgi:hypothetical protein
MRAFVPEHPTRSGFDATVVCFDASAVVHTRSSSRHTPAPLSTGLLPQRSPPRLLTGAACGGLGSPPARRTRRALLHHWYSTLHAGDLLHRHHSTSGHTRGSRTRFTRLTSDDQPPPSHGRHAEAVALYDRAIALTDNAAERKFLTARRAAVEHCAAIDSQAGPR